ncbi:MAG: Hint domain-containing protein [Alphaproteobacteria bacterium]|nr:Hint domain-containing protein [Alphaproteobacteria bacterium]
MPATTFQVTTEAELNAALSVIAGGTGSYTITLTSDIIFDTALQPIMLAADGSLVLDGAGHSLNGGFAWQGVVALSGTTTLKDITITGMAAIGGSGGGGWSMSGAFGDSGATGSGGGAGLGGGLFVAGPNVVGGSTITAGAVVIVSNGNISGNLAKGGDALSASGTADIRYFGGGGGLGGDGGSGSLSGAYRAGGGGGFGSGADGGGYHSGVLPGFGGAPAAAGQAAMFASAGAGAGGAAGGAYGGGGGAGIASGAGGGGGIGGVAGGGTTGGAGGFGGGGGAGSGSGGAGGFGGGGGGGGTGVGGAGGFGGGGGVGAGGVGLGGWGGGNGYLAAHGLSRGGAGLGAGGGIFVQQGGQLVFAQGQISGNYVQYGNGGNSGRTAGGGIFFQGNNSFLFAPPAGTTLTINNTIGDQTGTNPIGAPGSAAMVVTGGGTVVLFGGSSSFNRFSGGTTIIGATLDLRTTNAGGSGTISFSAGTAEKLIAPAGLSNTLVGFAVGDTIDITNRSPQSVAVTTSGTNTLIGGMTLRGSFGAVQLGDDGNGGTLVTLACFAEGTRVLTDRGEVAVERLRVGDLVPGAVSRQLRPITWIGQRWIDCTQHPRPHEAWPVRISAGAMGPGIPRRDLFLSGDHAIRVRLEGARSALVPARLLVNGMTVRREAVPSITYWHVELPAHDVVIAEGLECESYLDTGNRGAFAGEAIEMLHPDFSAGIWDAAACLPLVSGGAEVAALRQRLRARARAIEAGHGLTAEPGIRISCRGRDLAIGRDGDRLAVELPADAGRLVIHSRQRVPAWVEDASDDPRTLGVAVAGMVLDGHALTLDDRRLGAGWHATEDGLRWSDGAGEIDVRGARRLEVRIAHCGYYPVETPAIPAAAAGHSGT